MRGLFLACILFMVGCSSPMAPTETVSAGKGFRRAEARAPWCDRRVRCDCKELGEDLEVVYVRCEAEGCPGGGPQPGGGWLSCPNPANACLREGCPAGSVCLSTPDGYFCIAEAPVQ